MKYPERDRVVAFGEGVSAWVSHHEKAIVDGLSGLLKIPSVSTDPTRRKYIDECAGEFANLLRSIGLDAKVIEGYGMPYVFAQRIISDDKPTILIYGHYDVQPEGDDAEWETPPFEPSIRNGRIYARGSSDNKGQIYANIMAIKYLIESNNLNFNVKFIIEGEEEIGSPNINRFMSAFKEMLRANYVFISDTSINSLDKPVITSGVRGLLYMEIEARGPNRDLHSGTFGGAIRNPLYELCRLLSMIRDPISGKIMIPGFYDRVEPPSPPELDAILDFKDMDSKIMRELDVKCLDGDGSHSFLYATTLVPSYDINGIWGGYTGEGSKTVLPSRAHAKISFRLVPNQDPDEIYEATVKFLNDNVHAGVRLSFKKHASSPGVVLDTSSPEFQIASHVMESILGRKPYAVRCGGTIPICSSFKNIFGISPVMVGLATDYDNMHGPNESFPLEHLFKGIVILATTFYFLGNHHE